MNKKENKMVNREMVRLKKQEDKFLFDRMHKKDTWLNQLLEDKVPEKLQATLNSAFAKAFALIFEKGTAAIEKTYNKEKRQTDYMVKEYADSITRNRKSLRSFSKKAKGTHATNVAVSGASGIGMGILGIGLPDIPLFTASLLRGIYELAMNYGYEYESEEERYFILQLIRGAVSYGGVLQTINDDINQFIETGELPDGYDRNEYIKGAADSLSGELLYMKFLQGIPIVGAVGGSYNAIYMQQIMKFADMKYRRRFYLDRK